MIKTEGFSSYDYLKEYNIKKYNITKYPNKQNNPRVKEKTIVFNNMSDVMCFSLPSMVLLGLFFILPVFIAYECGSSCLSKVLTISISFVFSIASIVGLFVLIRNNIANDNGKWF